MAIVEINNENGLIHAALAGRLEHLPTDKLHAQWNEWLKRGTPRPKNSARHGSRWMNRLATNCWPGPWILEQHARQSRDANQWRNHRHDHRARRLGTCNTIIPVSPSPAARPVTLTFRAKAGPACDVTVSLPASPRTVAAPRPEHAREFDNRVADVSFHGCPDAIGRQRPRQSRQPRAAVGADVVRGHLVSARRADRL